MIKGTENAISQRAAGNWRQNHAVASPQASINFGIFNILFGWRPVDRAVSGHARHCDAEQFLDPGKGSGLGPCTEISNLDKME